MPGKRPLVLCDIERYSSESSVFGSPSYIELVDGSMLDKRSYCKKIRKMKIIIDKFFIGRDKFILQVLYKSANPIEDLSNYLSMKSPIVYRNIHYLRDVLKKFYIYFESKNYKDGLNILRLCIPSKRFVVFSFYVMCRNTLLVSKLLGRKQPVIYRHVKFVMDFLYDNRYVDDIKDLYDLFIGIKNLKKHSYRYGKLNR